MLRKDQNRRRLRPDPRDARNGGRGADRSRGGESERDPTREFRDSRDRRDSRFLLYVEGPRDREILEYWARRFDPELSRCVERSTVILGGRQPARALTDFRKRGGVEAGLSGLIVLDRDDHREEQSAAAPASALTTLSPTSSPSSTIVAARGAILPPTPVPHRMEQDLEVFVWGLRHIESYLLVPAAIRRAVGLHHDDRRIEDFLERQSRGERASHGESTGAESGADSLHAKRILGASGSLSEALGAELRAGEIARAMRKDDLHQDVHTLFGRISDLAGIDTAGPEVVVRTRPS